MKKNSLSILIPIYNGDCLSMIKELCHQATSLPELEYEILAVDDASTDGRQSKSPELIGSLPHCRFMALEENIGRARIRNLMASLARYEWLLFLDCDMTIISADFLERYLNTDGDVVYGGYKVGEAESSNLRYRYEKSCEQQHTAEERRKRPYQHFHTCNFLVRRDIMQAHPFDEQFLRYGYEDVLFGRRLREAGIAITHIANPTGFYTFEDNAHFVSKTEEGLQTLNDKRELLRGYSRLLTIAEGIHIGAVKVLIRLTHRLFGGLERKNLCGRNPSLKVFKYYKLGYFFTLTKSNEQL
ncbi:MAG: glycosyltransferase [Prevotella sp.]|nr:glycosyltransferase [Prevotella sp.]